MIAKRSAENYEELGGGGLLEKEIDNLGSQRNCQQKEEKLNHQYKLK
jgi:hypothetical protein